MPEIELDNSLTCILCDRVVNTFFNAVDEGVSPDVIVDRLVVICKDLNIYTERVCRGTVETVMVRNCPRQFKNNNNNNNTHFVIIHKIIQPILIYINNHTHVIRGNVCGTVLPALKCKLAEPDKMEWTIKESTIPKPPVREFVAPPVKT